MDIQISVTAVQIAEVGKCHKFEFENEKPPFECEANAPYVSNPLGLNPHKSAPFSAITSFFGGGNAESAENAGLRSQFGINAMTDFLKVNPGKSPDKILECALRHGVG